MKKVTCSYGVDCFISGIEINQEPVLLLDFNIKIYKVLPSDGSGWAQYDLPPNALVHDKLYLTQSAKDRVLSVIQGFLSHECIVDAAAVPADRGLQLVELKDFYKNTIALQESSSFDPAIWFGCYSFNEVMVRANDELTPFEFPEGSLLIHDRLHLKTKEARRLKKAIELEWNNAFITAEQKQLAKAIPPVSALEQKAKKKIGL